MKLPIPMRGIFVVFAVFVFIRGEFGLIASIIAATVSIPFAGLVIAVSVLALIATGGHNAVTNRHATADSV